ncbi:10655_t:CDS:1, partial [Diversispora eburnea]
TNQSARMDRIESKVDEIGQMTSQFGKMVLENQSKKPIAKTNRTQRYYPFQPINSSVLANEEGNEGGYDEEKDIWYDSSEKKKHILPVNKLSSEELKTQYSASSNQPKTYNELFPKLSPVMRKMCQSHTVQKEESNEWFSSLQYLNAKIDNLLISDSFLDPGSEIGVLNNATINALGWKADKPSNFDIKGNSKYSTESLEWFIDVPVSIKDKD